MRYAAEAFFAFFHASQAFLQSSYQVDEIAFGDFS
jgi:hypothetical protein